MSVKEERVKQYKLLTDGLHAFKKLNLSASDQATTGTGLAIYAINEALWCIAEQLERTADRLEQEPPR